MQGQPPELFISYAHSESKYKDELIKVLNRLKERKQISTWHDAEVVPGASWNDEIVAHLNSSRIILLLISNDFMDSKYIRNIELRQAAARHERGEIIVIPVLVSDAFGWRDEPFGKKTLGDLQGLPPGLLPVDEWPRKNKAYNKIAEGILATVLKLDSAFAYTDRVSEPMMPAPPPRLPSLSLPRRSVIEFVRRRDYSGRDIVERLVEELGPEDNRLVALWGAGGVGKTTLAIEAAYALVGTFGQRIVWVSSLRQTKLTFGALLDEIATKLGYGEIRNLSIELKEQQVRSLIASAPTLVVVDGFETIAQKDQKLCAEFLAVSSRCPVLITTRKRVNEASNISVDVMLQAEILEFINRWIANQSREPSIFDAVDRLRIIQATNSNPLITQWALAQIDRALEPNKVLDELAQGKGAAAIRVFENSFRLLEEASRAILLGLSLFAPSAGRASLQAVAGLAGKDSAFDEAIGHLADLWLITPVNGGARLTMGKLTRELAKARLSRGPLDGEFRRRFVAHFLSYVEAHAKPSAEDFDALETEKDNVLAAMDMASKLGEGESLIRIMNVVGQEPEGFLDVRGYWDEAIRRGGQAFEAARAMKDESALARIAGNIGVIRMRRGEYDEARQVFQQALTNYQKLEDDKNIANALNNLGMVLQEQGDLAAARQHYNDSLKIKESRGDKKSIARTLHNLGVLAQKQNDLAEARRLYNESLEIERHLDNPNSIATTLHNLGVVAQEQGDLVSARRFYEESLEIRMSLHNPHGIAISQGQLGLLARAEEDKKEAEKLLRAALEVFEDLKSPYAATTREMLAELAAEPT